LRRVAASETIIDIVDFSQTTGDQRGRKLKFENYSILVRLAASNCFQSRQGIDSSYTQVTSRNSAVSPLNPNDTMRKAALTVPARRNMIRAIHY
jgi:hypothetical protein